MTKNDSAIRREISKLINSFYGDFAGAFGGFGEVDDDTDTENITLSLLNRDKVVYN